VCRPDYRVRRTVGGPDRPRLFYCMRNNTKTRVRARYDRPGWCVCVCVCVYALTGHIVIFVDFIYFVFFHRFFFPAPFEVCLFFFFFCTSDAGIISTGAYLYSHTRVHIHCAYPFRGEFRLTYARGPGDNAIFCCKSRATRRRSEGREKKK